MVHTVAATPAGCGMATVRMERIDPRENVARFYELSLTAEDAFGHPHVDRHWGRIGTRGQWATDGYPDPDAARQALHRHVRERHANGYRVVADPEQLLLAAADEAELLVRGEPTLAGSSFGQILASLASAARHVGQGSPPHVSDHRQQSIWTDDAVDDRLRTRLLTLIDEIADAILSKDDARAVTRRFQAPPSPGADSAVARLVPRAQHGLLNAFLIELFAGERWLDALAHDLARRDVHHLGDLIRLPRSEVAAAAQRTGGGSRAITALTARLERLGLGLGSTVPRWHRPGRGLSHPA